MAISISDDTQPDPGGTSGGAITYKEFVLPFQIHEDDFATLAAADGIVTLTGTITLADVTGSFYVTLSKLVPVYSAS